MRRNFFFYSHVLYAGDDNGIFIPSILDTHIPSLAFYLCTQPQPPRRTP